MNTLPHTMNVLKNHWHLAFSIFIFVGAFLVAERGHAAPTAITYRYTHYLYTVRPTADWFGAQEQWLYNGKPVRLPASLRAEGDVPLVYPEGFTKSEVQAWDRTVIEQALQSKIAAYLEREPGSVNIIRSGSGKITYEGVGLPGRKIDMDLLVSLTVQALEQNISDVFIPVTEIQPAITTNDPELQKVIKEVVTVGESDFTGSAPARRHNIAVGLARFNGHLIPQGTVFSFNEVLGPVNASTGYKKELVIKGDKTLPDYGGGLCQISSTAYRGVWEYGFPIEQRKNHSFAVRYYGPYGTDATIYPPNLDMKFTNDSPGPLLIQTHSEGDTAYFIYYGQKDDRKSDVFGPFTWGFTSPPPDRTEDTLEIPAGTRRKVGERVPGLSAAWFRRVVKPGQEPIVEPTYSIYQARPLYWQVGVESLPEATVEEVPEPDFF